MAKKTVATLHEGSKDGRAYTKVIKMVKSPKTIQKRLKLNEVSAFFCIFVIKDDEVTPSRK